MQKLLNRVKELGFSIKVPQYAKVPGGNFSQFLIYRPGVDVEKDEQYFKDLSRLVKDPVICARKRILGLYVHLRFDSVGINLHEGQFLPNDWCELVLRHIKVQNNMFTREDAVGEISELVDKIHEVLSLVSIANLTMPTHPEAVNGLNFARINYAAELLTKAVQDLADCD